MTTKTDFVASLRATAATLEPLTKGMPNPYALAWWANLRTIASMIEAQEAMLSAAQIAYLKRELFGGMGSLNDLWFSQTDAPGVNERLDQARHDLFSSFSRLSN